MKTKCSIGIVAVFVALVPATEAWAFRGRGAAFAVGMAAGSHRAHEEAQPQQQAPAPVAPPAPPPAAADARLPSGTKVSALPAGCVSKVEGGVNSFSCGANVYRAAYEGSTLVYVVQ